jgi:DNA mismatch repair protein MutS
MTPAMQQFHDVKADYPDHIVLFRMGDFYETFYDDAKKASQILNITLTARDRERKVPMAGIPFHALDNYLGKLVEANQKVVIVEQLENPSEAQGVIKRGIVKIVTPGTNTLDTTSKSNNYLISIFKDQNGFYLAFTDIIEGVINTIKFDNQVDLQNNILILNPKEILLPKETIPTEFFTKDFYPKISHLLNLLNNELFEKVYLKERFIQDIQQDIDMHTPEVFALLNYLADTQKTNLDHISKINKISTSSHMKLDNTAITNLELIDGARKSSISLFHILDKCKTSSGSKKLKNWLVKPLLDQKLILQRQESIESLINLQSKNLDEIHQELGQTHDLYRLTSKIGLSTANARDLRNAVETIRVIFKFISSLKGLKISDHISKIVNNIEAEIKNSQNILANINKTIREDPPLSVREGHMVKPGIDQDLDELHKLKTGGTDWLKAFEKSEIKRAGIPTLKVRFNKVFGYYIEVSKGQSAKVPDNYIRKQTLVNAERYITTELKEHEANILGADDKICKIEFEIFSKILNESKQIIPSLQRINDLISEIDIYFALANVALENKWIKPEVTENNDEISVVGGRHPVVENLLLKHGKEFVNNDICVDKSHSLQIITGPNMGGKSTFIRQVALITLLAQIGSFVPATSAKIGIVDRIFTRVGASDNLAGGESTFMVEMLETAEILNNATKKSLIILDEVGRGTSTFDGMSIAWAICEFLQDLGAKTLFATHYHELTELANKYQNVQNLSVKVVDYQGEIVFMHQIISGKADKSYGIHVAKLAGLPDKVIKSSEKVLKLLEKEKNKLQPKPQELFNVENLSPDAEEKPDYSVFIDKFRKIDIDRLSPLEALQKLSELKSSLIIEH